MKKKIETKKAPAAIGPYSQGIATERMVFVSGQLPINPENGEMPDTITEQTVQSLNNLKNILESDELSMENVCKTTVFLSDMNDFSEMNKVYEAFFSSTVFPARSAFEVARLPKNALVEIEAIAWK